MPSKTKLKNAAIAAKLAALPKIPKELIDQFVNGPMTIEAVNAASMAYKRALIERAISAALGHHQGYAADAAKPDALAAVFSATTLQTCIVHLIRNSLDYANWKNRKLPAAIRTIYTAASGEAGQAELDALERSPLG